MVQRLLSGEWRGARKCRRIVCAILVLSAVAAAGTGKKPVPASNVPPDLPLEGGRRLTYERSFSSETEVRKKPGFFAKLVNVLIGAPDTHVLVRPYSIAVDSHGRAIITDPGAGGIHIFDFAQNKYKFIERQNARDPMQTPQCVAIDADDKIYVTDSKSGKIFVFNADGKYQHALGSLKRGEGFFKRPTGIAVDSPAQRIYLTDTLRDKVYVLDMQGNVLQTIGKRGDQSGDFNLPTDVKLYGSDLVVVDTMNFRIQLLDRSGAPLGAIGAAGDTTGAMFRPKGVAIDSEGHYYVVDGLWGIVQVFDREGRLLYYFGKRGTRLGEFQLPTGVFIDAQDQVFVVDSYNRRVQVFRYHALRARANGGGR